MVSPFQAAPCREVRLGSWRWRVSEPYARPEFLERLHSPRGLLAPPAVPVERDPPRVGSELVRLTLPDGPGRPLFIKHYRAGRFWNMVKDCFRPSRAELAFTQGLALQRLGLGTATPVAFGERRCARWLCEAILICEEVPRAVTLYEFFPRCADPQLRCRALRALARLMASLHNAGYSHTDPHALNFLIRDGDVGRLVLIDLDAVRPRGLWAGLAARRDLRKMRQRSPLGRWAHLRFAAEYARARSPRLSARELARAVGR